MNASESNAVTCAKFLRYGVAITFYQLTASAVDVLVMFRLTA